MKARVARSWGILASALLAAGTSCLLAQGCTPASAGTHVLRGTVSDAANGMPVYRARVVFGGRTVTLFTTRSFTLTHLPGGEGTLSVEAEGYSPWSRRITLSGRETEVPVALTGLKVPGLAGILVWCAWETQDLRIDIRLTDSDGTTLRHFPALQFEGYARLAVNLGSEESPRPGAMLFEGALPVAYNSDAPLDRLSSRIPRQAIGQPGPGHSRGVLEYELSCPQGTYRWIRGDVPLEGRD